MGKKENQAWLIAGALFISLWVLWGSGFNTFGVFFMPLLKEFGRSRALTSLGSTAIVLSAGGAAPLAGWLMGWIDTRLVMGVGATLAGVSLFGASQASSFNHLMAWYVALGMGLGASSWLPASVIVSNWFKERQGTALGLTTSGMELGGMVMALVATHLIATHGWRVAYLVLATPIFVVALPLILIVVKARPEDRAPAESNGGKIVPLLSGLDVRQALQTRGFWLLALVQFVFGFGAGGSFVHLVPYLLKLGYSAQVAALAFSSALGIVVVGKPLMGMLGDNIGGRKALAAGLAICAGSIVLLLNARLSFILVLAILVYGLTLTTPVALVPVVLTDIAGLKSLGPLLGVLLFIQTAGVATGPIFVGRLFDLNGTYGGGYAILSSLMLIAALSTMGCVGEKAGVVNPLLRSAT